jgi:SAM-dependent methyltransferase
MSGSYLEHYERTQAPVSERGAAGWLRKRLDRRARAMGQADRHALFLHRVLALAELAARSDDVRVLDVGCASGLALGYRAPNLRAFGVDRDDHYAARLEAAGITFHVADVATEPLPFEDGFFDLVMLNHVIEHVANYEHFAGEVRRVTAAVGHAYVRTPDITRVKGAFYDDYGHVKPYTPAALVDLMRAHGFEARHVLHSDHPRINLEALFVKRDGG